MLKRHLNNKTIKGRTNIFSIDNNVAQDVMVQLRFTNKQ